MSDPVRNERLTAGLEGEFVVFLIGLRVNRWWKVARWLPLFLKMRELRRELEGRPELGYLGGEAWWGRTTVMVQYWRSWDLLMAYAQDKGALHLRAWNDFNRRIGFGGDVGIWHETYRIAPGGHETVYHNMPPFGIGRIAPLHSVRGPLKTALGRLDSTRPTKGG